MAYFPHAYQKMLVGTTGFSTQASQTTLALTPGEVGVIDAKTNTIQDLTVAPSYSATPMLYLAQGSFYTSDKLGPFHGGYQETVKTKGINPKYVSRFYVTEPAASVANTIVVGCDNPFKVNCEENFDLRIDVKGSEVLRTLTRNAYLTAVAYSGCCPTGAGCADACDITPTVSSTVIFSQWADYINNDPIMSNFISASLEYFTAGEGDVPTNHGFEAPSDWDPAVNADQFVKLHLTAAYMDTKFGNCSFSKTDHYEIEPLRIYASATDLSGNPCNENLFCVNTLTEAQQGKGFGETLLRELILSKSYRQDYFSEDPRMREILNDSSLTEISRNTSYTVYYILHSVPRNSNPSGMLDADQYLVKIVVDQRDADFENYMDAYLASANTAVSLEVLP